MLASPRQLFLIFVLVLAPPGSLWSQPPATDESGSQYALALSLTRDASLQDATIIAIRRALGARDQTSAVRRGRFADAIRFHIVTYRSIRDASVLATIQNRYSVARGELLEARLPESIAELMLVLESL